MPLPSPSTSSADLARQKALLDEDLPLRLIVAPLAILLTGIFLPIWLPLTAGVIYLGVEFIQQLLLRRLEQDGFRRGKSYLLILINSGLGMSCFVLPPTVLWFEPGEVAELGAFIYIIGAFLAVTLVRPVILPLALANCLPLALALLVILGDLVTRLDQHELIFLLAALALLVAYFIVALLNNHKMQHELAQARDAALARAETQARFLATMSHELRTPLNGILGMAQVLAERGAGAVTEAEVIRESARAMAVLVGDLLDNAAIEAGALRIEPRPVDPVETVAAQIRLWQPRFAERGLTLSFSPHPDLAGLVRVDPLRLAQCLGNLLSNALRSTRTGGARVDLALTPDGLDLTVTDTGQGLPEGAEDRLFRPYEPIHPDGAQPGGGTGLGLAISRGMARAMGGDLRFERPVGGGARFRLTIRAPRLEAEAADQTSRLAIDPAPLATAARISRLEGRRVLVVDDIATNRLVLRLLLRGFGVVTEEAPDGDAALIALALTAFDAVLMDVRMPGLSGPATLEQLRAAGHDLPVIAVSADAGSDDRSRALAQGFSGYLVKPVEAEQLEKALAEVLGQATGENLTAGHAHGLAGDRSEPMAAPSAS